ncbi:MAG: phage tail sheath C-terminal domain-containing protein [Bacteroidia bacterium]
MASSYKTPGVYIEEISSLPASVAQVETAIPAFIGYTEYHEDTDGTDLLNVPTRISSLVEYQEKYGGAAPLAVTQVNLDAFNQVSSIASDATFYMYDSLRMFWANGGGDCYIVSVGKYRTTLGGITTVTESALSGALAPLKKADEPTLLLAPDAVLMDQSDINSLYQAMLSHANYMQDRFCVFDLKENGGNDFFDDAVTGFREGIGVNYLKYGAAYGPWIKATLPKSVSYADLKGKIFKTGTQKTLEELADPTSDQAQFTAQRLDALTADNITYTTSLNTLTSGSDLEEAYSVKLAAFSSQSLTTASAIRTKTEALFDFLFSTIHLYDAWLNNGVAGSFADRKADYGFAASIVDGKTYLYNETNTFVASTVRDIASTLLEVVVEYNTKFAPTTAYDPTSSFTWAKNSDATIWNSIFTALPVTSTTDFFGTTAETAANAKAIDFRNNAIDDFTLFFTPLANAIKATGLLATGLVPAIEASATEQIPTYKSIVTAISKELVVLPPSGAIVGVYAATDRNRGVWKAPANVSLAATAGVQTLISHEEQENLNVDVVAGKSINAIRPFTGKGILVWGARTLAGNDNEWRYVPVRRLYIMVEESIKKATEFVVFEPNDKNTWVRMKGMISNFLTELWRAGALAGAKPEQSFFVNVGLGETMTPLDILEGRMIVEIGLAAVRPAEFIILRFYHKLQES